MDIPFVLFFIIGIVFVTIFGVVFSSSRVWKSLFNSSETYLKAGEYGETETGATWSPWKEPINAATSLAYSLFGVVIILTGLTDAYYGPQSPLNKLALSPGYSLLYGGSCLYLGIASFFFHASHSEVWRKADAGMTSGVMAAPVVFGLWDRTRPPAADPMCMVLCAVLIQFSFTHGYLPYGSSDILLPTLVAITWSLELLPAFGGAVASSEYRFWLQCCYGALGGMLLRAADIKRKSTGAFSNIMTLFFVLSLFPFAYYLGLQDHVVVAGLCAGVVVWKSPAKGHLFWHFGSSFALFIWWYMLRTRPGDPDLSQVSSNVVNISVVVFFIVVKNGIRRLFMNMTFLSTEMRNRVMFFLEHAFFSAWGWWVMVHIPGHDQSWLEHAKLCWSEPVYPFEAFHLFYQVKVATHAEDLIYIFSMFLMDLRGESAPVGVLHDDDSKRGTKVYSDVKMNLHHVSTAALCIASYLSGYARIGSIVMFLHDVSDLPLDLLRIANAMDWKNLQIVSFVMTVALWLYWRLWYFPISVLLNIATDSKSLHVVADCTPGTCTWAEVPERVPFLLLLGSLQVLHVIWFAQILKKAFRMLAGVDS